MQKIYRILRNNKEQGPYDLDELVRLPINASDLIWQDGKSAAWLYPSEVDLLRPYVGSNPDPASASKYNSLNPVKEQEVKETVDPEEKETLTSEKLERKAEEIYKRVQAYSRDNPVKDVEVKYARSLDDLKQEYAHWLYKKKKRKLFIPLQVKIITVCLLLLITAAVFLLRTKDNPSQKEKISGTGTEKDNLNQLPVKGNKSPVLQLSPVKKKASSVDEFIDSVRRVLAEQERERNKIPVVYYKKKPARVIQQKTDTTIARHSELPSARLVDMLARTFPGNNGRNLELVEVTIHNNSKESLKAVSVDVFYYRKGDRLFDKKTLYFKNIHPGNSYTLSLPANNKAQEAKFKLGQVSWN